MLPLQPGQTRQVERTLALIAAGERDMGEAVARIPVEDYTCPERFARETRMLFRRHPVVLGPAGGLDKAGATLVHDALGLPILVIRGRDGRLRAFLNACRHRSTRLVSGGADGVQAVCRRSSLVCPYHGWTYGLDGALRTIPQAEAFPGVDPAEHGLVELPLAVRHGLIWLVADPGGSIDLDAHLGEIGGDLDAFGLGDHVPLEQSVTRRMANWKLIIDAFQEGYHIQRLHRDTIAPFFADGLGLIEPVGRHLRATVVREGLMQSKRMPAAMEQMREEVTFSYYLFPHVVMVFSPDYVNVLALFPQAPDETVVVNTMLVPHAPRDEAERDHYERSFALLDGGVFQKEDFTIAEAMQEGLRTGANRHLTLGRNEYGVAEFHRILGEALAEA